MNHDSIIDDDDDALCNRHAGRQPKRRNRPSNLSRIGNFVILIIVCDAASGYWPSVCSDNTVLQSDGKIVGVCLSRWVFETASTLRVQFESLASRERSRSCARDIFGYISYPIFEFARLQNPIDTLCSPSQQIQALFSEYAFEFDYSCSAFGRDRHALQSLVMDWQSKHGINKAPRVCTLKLHPGMIASILQQPSVAHIVGLANRVPTSRLLARTELTAWKLKQFRDSCRDSGDPNHKVRIAAPPTRNVWKGMLDVKMVLEWLDTSLEVKNIRHLNRASLKFASLFARANSLQVSTVLGALRPANFQVIRAARIRLDAVACNLFRALWDRLIDDSISIYLYLDSSPQLRGEELFAVSFEVHDHSGNIVWERRLAPLVALQRDFFDACGKALALIFIIFLLVGPSVRSIMRFCDCVRSITTDMGTERKLARFPCILEEFFGLMLGSQVTVPHRTYLFPIALSAPGWNHGWDIVLRRGLASLSWFSDWLEGLKALIAFFRSKLWRGTLCRYIQHQLHKTVIAELIDSVRVPSIAEWRWGTLWSAVEALGPVVETLGHYFDVRLFSSSKEAKKIALAGKSLISHVWASRFEFIRWYCSWVCTIQSWGKGSRQRDEALRTGSDYNQLFNGRRLGEAETYVEQSLKRGLADCEEWHVGTFGTGFDYDGLIELKTCVRASYVLAAKRHEYLSRLPYLLVRILEPGLKARILKQYSEFENHHPLTDRFLSPGGELRRDVDSLDAQGGNATRRLLGEVEALSLVPLDDSIAESPHAVGNSLGRHARGSTFGWVAASMRVSQNLTDVRDWSAALKMDLTQEWLTYTKVLQSKSRNFGRPMRVKPKEFRYMFYHMGVMTKPLRTSAAAEDDVNLPIADADPGGDADLAQGNLEPEEPKRRKRSSVDVEQVQHAQQLALMKEYLLACLVPGKVVSFKVADGDESSTCFMQVVLVQPKVTVVDTCTERGHEDMQLRVSVQELSPQVPVAADPRDLAAAGSVDVFCFGDEHPHDFDFGQCEPSSREEFLQWSARPSASSGCTCLQDPQALMPDASISIMDRGMPTLCLLDSLSHAGWAGQPRLVTHTPDSAKVFDVRRPLGKKDYLRCIIVLGELFSAGIVELRSGRPKTYYRFVLRFKKLPADDANMTALKKALGDCDDEVPVFSVPAVPLPAPAVVEEGIVMMSSGDEEEPVPRPPSSPVLPPGAPEPRPAEASEPLPLQGDGIIADDPGAPEVVVPLAGDWPSRLEGMPLRKIAGRKGSDSKHTYAGRLSIKCPNPDHVNCSKSRSVQLCVEQLGPQAPLVFLGAWAERFDLPADQHGAKFNPTLAEMRDYKARRLDTGRATASASS